MEIKGEHKALSEEKDELEKLVKSEKKQWAKIKKQVGEIKKLFGPDTALGKRRTKGKAPVPMAVEALTEALTEKEPITVIVSDKGWIRAMKGHGHNPKDFKYKDGDSEGYVMEAQTTDKILLFGTNGRFYTLAGDKLPSGRGLGEPVKLMVEMGNDADVTGVMIHTADAKILVAATDGRGFIVPSNDVLAQTKNGKQILNVDGNVEAKVCRYVDAADDHIAVIGKNRKMIVFKLDQIPEMSRGRGVTLQKYKDGTLSDAKTFNWKTGLTYKSRGTDVKTPDLKPWLGERAQAGKLPPNGFPSNSKFG
jgi:topoisomerase-4 subunit A